jgi:hypothetical protein
VWCPGSRRPAGSGTVAVASPPRHDDGGLAVRRGAHGGARSAARAASRRRPGRRTGRGGVGGDLAAWCEGGRRPDGHPHAVDRLVHACGQLEDLPAHCGSSLPPAQPAAPGRPGRHLRWRRARRCRLGAPAARAGCRVDTATPPLPLVTTGLSAMTGWSANRAFQAVGAAAGRRAAPSWPRSARGGQASGSARGGQASGRKIHVPGERPVLAQGYLFMGGTTRDRGPPSTPAGRSRRRGRCREVSAARGRGPVAAGTGATGAREPGGSVA